MSENSTVCLQISYSIVSPFRVICLHFAVSAHSVTMQNLERYEVKYDNL